MRFWEQQCFVLIVWQLSKVMCTAVILPETQGRRIIESSYVMKYFHTLLSAGRGVVNGCQSLRSFSVLPRWQQLFLLNGSLT
ncbi:hypothetical protein QQF64_001861 [Cirrhinus molitorella]|uniref:Secreted protein n=1 Tax=Cirrhinus molitorella TaxID=172907 RepID=A0ABR3MNH7_9TELE